MYPEQETSSWWTVIYSFSHETWLKTNQKNAMQEMVGSAGCPAVIVIFSAGSTQVMQYRAKPTNVAE
jgi:hypothetical protein